MKKERSKNSHASVPLKLVFRLKVDPEHLKVEEDKLKIIWHAAGIEKWLLGIYMYNTLRICKIKERSSSLPPDMLVGSSICCQLPQAD